MTDQELEGLARQALNILHTEIRNAGRCSFFLGYHIPGAGLRRMPKVEALIVARLGEDWLNHGGKKELAFGLLRVCATMARPEAVVLVTPMNHYRATDAFLKLPPDRQKFYSASANRNREAVARGYMTVDDSLTALAQTPERVCISSLITGQEQPLTNFWRQDEYDGRTKFYVEPDEAMKLLAKLEASG
jgi:hypothetical protein